MELFLSWWLEIKLTCIHHCRVSSTWDWVGSGILLNILKKWSFASDMNIASIQYEVYPIPSLLRAAVKNNNICSKKFRPPPNGIILSWLNCPPPSLRVIWYFKFVNINFVNNPDEITKQRRNLSYIKIRRIVAEMRDKIMIFRYLQIKCK